MSKNIFVFVEQRGGSIQKVSLELIGEATRLAADLGEAVVAVLMGHNIADKADMLCQYGADEVLVLDHPVLAEYTTEPYVKGMEYVIRSYAPNIVLFGASSIGRDMAPRIAGRIHTGLTADCTRLDVDVEKYKGYLRAATSLSEDRIEKLDTTDRNLKMTRPAFGGNVMATIICPNYRPQMATVRPGVMEMPQRDMSRQGKVTVVDAGLSMDDRNVEILQVVHDDKKPVDITEAKVLVSAPRATRLCVSWPKCWAARCPPPVSAWTAAGSRRIVRWARPARRCIPTCTWPAVSPALSSIWPAWRAASSSLPSTRTRPAP